MKIEYALMYTNRKTIGIIIKDGKIKVCAPKNIKKQTIEKFILSKSKWIEEKLNEYNKKEKQFSEYLSYDKFLYFGNTLLVDFYLANKICVNQLRLCLPRKLYINNCKNKDNPKLLNAIYKFYFFEASIKLESILKQTSVKFGISFNNFNLTNAKTKWGSCDCKNNITLNWRLVFLPQELIEYVVIHELAHTIEHNHSKAFWDKVKSFSNNFKNDKQKLKELSLLITLFR